MQIYQFTQEKIFHMVELSKATAMHLTN